MSGQGDLVSSSENTLHRSTGEVIFYENGERTKMKCGVALPGVGHPYSRYMVEDWRGDICGRCFPEIAERSDTDDDPEIRTDGGVEESGSYRDAICPGCGSVLTGSREPGDRDYCQDAEREVTLAPANKNVRAHDVSVYDGPDFVPYWERVRGAVESHRGDERVPVSFDPRTLHTGSGHGD